MRAPGSCTSLRFDPGWWCVVTIDLEVFHDRVDVHEMVQQRLVPSRGRRDDPWQKDDVVRRHAHSPRGRGVSLTVKCYPCPQTVLVPMCH